jgi:hypothetical protein
MKQMLKRKDGSYSQRGLWDNIRANKGSGKKPTKDMLKQENKIKEMNSKPKSKSPSKKMGGGYKAPQYQMGGDMIEPSKEVNFDRPMAQSGMAKSKKMKPDYIDIDKDGNKTEPMKNAASNKKMKSGGGKSMKPGGGGRFEKLVGELKGKGKSEDSAKAIAASIGRKKYGKSRFQEMAKKG